MPSRGTVARGGSRKSAGCVARCAYSLRRGRFWGVRCSAVAAPLPPTRCVGWYNPGFGAVGDPAFHTYAARVLCGIRNTGIRAVMLRRRRCNPRVAQCRPIIRELCCPAPARVSGLNTSAGSSPAPFCLRTRSGIASAARLGAGACRLPGCGDVMRLSRTLLADSCIRFIARRSLVLPAFRSPAGSSPRSHTPPHDKTRDVLPRQTYPALEGFSTTLLFARTCP